MFNLLFYSLSQLRYVEVRISRSVSVSPLEFEITRVDCVDPDQLASLDPYCEFLSTIWIKKSDWLTIRNGLGILIHSAWQRLILNLNQTRSRQLVCSGRATNDFYYDGNSIVIAWRDVNFCRPLLIECTRWVSSRDFLYNFLIIPVSIWSKNKHR